jgi:DNA polymerase/3'-5' exonuclease PolX
MLPAEVLVKRYPRDAIEAAYDVIAPYLFPFRHSIVGSYRRGLPDSKDIDIIVLCQEGEFNRLRQVIKELKGVVYISGGDTKFHGTICGVPFDIDRIDWVGHYAAHLLYRTGPAALNIKMRQIAKEKGFTLNEKIEAKDEEELFHMVGMYYIPPEKRDLIGKIVETTKILEDFKKEIGLC